ncbi:TrkA-C domain protein [Methanobrevibacter curvatus]|uniref:TrkA-C domain protein n=2 Tax=Methanobrevibacter curvatus TaxID=49547 RepID=A0A166CLL4_9EURY|nr:potassium channel family protein [Methanobrevibacter curvatus]KZX15277.1 TrkA-C domain protein [Methanobrevibacter curvatus]
MATIKDILVEMKDMSELMVDLSYSAVLFNSKDAAEEVITLENKINSLNYEIKKQSLLAARSVEDAERLTVLLEIAEAAESIANSAKDIADLVLKGFKPHPVFKMVMEESEETMVRVVVKKESQLVQKSLGELFLATRTGMRVISIRRDESWIYGPDRNTIIFEDDILISKGTVTGSGILQELADGEISLDELGLDDFPHDSN